MVETVATSAETTIIANRTMLTTVATGKEKKLGLGLMRERQTWLGGLGGFEGDEGVNGSKPINN